jgi:hypothetical protein
MATKHRTTPPSISYDARTIPRLTGMPSTSPSSRRSSSLSRRPLLFQVRRCHIGSRPPGDGWSRRLAHGLNGGEGDDHLRRFGLQRQPPARPIRLGWRSANDASITPAFAGESVAVSPPPRPRCFTSCERCKHYTGVRWRICGCITAAKAKMLDE